MQDLIVYFSTQEKCGCLPETKHKAILTGMHAFKQ